MENQEPLSPLQNTVPAKDPKNSKNQAIILIVSGLILIAATAPFLYQKYFAAETTENLNTSSQATTTNQFADWQTYRNEEYGFEFKYPEGQEVHVSESFIGVGTAFWILQIEAKNVGRESVFDSSSNVVMEDINFAGKKAKEYVCPDNNKCPAQLSKSRSIKLIDLPQNWGVDNEIYYDAYVQDNSELADQILSTFKFTK